jgi:hypothetical protein
MHKSFFPNLSGIRPVRDLFKACCCGGVVVLNQRSSTNRMQPSNRTGFRTHSTPFCVTRSTAHHRHREHFVDECRTRSVGETHEVVRRGSTKSGAHASHDIAGRMPLIQYAVRDTLAVMSTIREIEDAIRKLPDDELTAFRAWFAEFDATAWDRQFEQDVAAGRLDALGDEALRDARDGRCTEL